MGLFIWSRFSLGFLWATVNFEGAALAVVAWSLPVMVDSSIPTVHGLMCEESMSAGSMWAWIFAQDIYKVATAVITVLTAIALFLGLKKPARERELEDRQKPTVEVATDFFDAQAIGVLSREDHRSGRGSHWHRRRQERSDRGHQGSDRGFQQARRHRRQVHRRPGGGG